MNKNILCLLISIVCIGSGGAATLTPIQLLNPTGSVTGNSIISSGSSTAPYWGNISLLTGVSGTLPVSSGGTGTGTLAGLALGNGTSAITAYLGTGCTNQFPRSINAYGVATCSSVANSDLVNSSITIGSTNAVLGSTYSSITGLTLIATTINKVAFTSPTTAATFAFGVDNATFTMQGTDTYVGRTTADTLTNKSLETNTNTLTINGTAINSVSGTGAVVLSTGNASSLTGLTSTQVTTALAYTPINKAGDTLTGIVKLTNGSSTLPSVVFANATNTGLYSPSANQIRVPIAGVDVLEFDSSGIAIGSLSNNSIRWLTFGVSTDLVLTKDGSNALNQRNGVNAQTSRLTNTYTDASNYEWLSTKWSSNLASINTEALGTGTQRAMGLQTAGGRVLVGTTTDDATNTLQVTGNTKITGTLNATTALQVNGVSIATTYAPLANAPLTGTPTAPTATAGTNTTQLATTAFVTNALVGTLPDFTATTGSIGGSALVAGSCATGTVAVSGSTTTMVPIVSPNTYPGAGFTKEAYVSSNGTVTVSVCAIIAGTPTAGTYNVRVIQ